MTRIRLDIAYDGTNYCGWQYQPNGLTIEEVLNRELSALLKEDIHVIGASRTDSGVHAYQNIAVFDTETRIPPEKICLALNQKLPGDISIQSSCEVPADWHPRKRNTVKTYEYRILNRRIPFPARRFDTYYTFHSLNVVKMQEAARYLIGEHDFKSFCSVTTQAEETIRTIYSAEIIREPLITSVIKRDSSCSSGKSGDSAQNQPVLSDDSSDSLPDNVDTSIGEVITIRLRGNGFLTHMVRIIAGTLMRVGTGMYEPIKVKEMLDACDRYTSGPKAPPQALTLISLEEVFGLRQSEHVDSDWWSYDIKRSRPKAVSTSTAQADDANTDYPPGTSSELIMPDEEYDTLIDITSTRDEYLERNIYRLVKHAFQDQSNRVFIKLPEGISCPASVQEFSFSASEKGIWEASDTYVLRS